MLCLKGIKKTPQANNLKCLPVTTFQAVMKEEK